MEEVEDSKTKTNPYEEIHIVVATHDHANSRCATLVNHWRGVCIASRTEYHT